MATSHPKDRFDDLPADIPRVGAHRAPARRGRGWILFAWAALATGVIVAAAVLTFTLIDSSSQASVSDAIASATPEPTADPVTDPSTIAASRNISITVLNGTASAGLAQIAEDALTKDKWPVASSADAQSTAHESTTVFYSNEDDEDVARGVSIALTVGDIELDETMEGAPIKVVLGADYQALQEAK